VKKIPTVFERDWEGDRSRVLPEIVVEVPEAAIPTRKRDGTAILSKAGVIYRRYDCKRGRTTPDGFYPCGERDEKTGHWFGWVPVGDGPEDKWHRAVEVPYDGSYELCGPKINGNPEHLDLHTAIRHGAEILAGVPWPVTHEGIKRYLGEHVIEGIVWWMDDAPVGKAKRRDFGLSWPDQGLQEP